ncbi:uncharacterized protein B0H18DRAFT_933881 [Fomitopsis serialis]|uniref:uncharacterized protein n=1 Tax=Fomitopsis serialis TaxID=139415 RepID=UPI0020077089|nr:uncharacterized protein B0H18DRAFT_933881 [Neoantrodia serialis]KAH9925126.1 hypothetical protein B0H18DRAFT_933881 [Neoantrodia serialis]
MICCSQQNTIAEMTSRNVEVVWRRSSRVARGFVERRANWEASDGESHHRSKTLLLRGTLYGRYLLTAASVSAISILLTCAHAHSAVSHRPSR